jgi:hypothetical protein
VIDLPTAQRRLVKFQRSMTASAVIILAMSVILIVCASLQLFSKSIPLNAGIVIINTVAALFTSPFAKVGKFNREVRAEVVRLHHELERIRQPEILNPLVEELFKSGAAGTITVQQPGLTLPFLFEGEGGRAPKLLQYWKALVDKH